MDWGLLLLCHGSSVGCFHTRRQGSFPKQRAAEHEPLEGLGSFTWCWKEAVAGYMKESEARLAADVAASKRCASQAGLLLHAGLQLVMVNV